MLHPRCCFEWIMHASVGGVVCRGCSRDKQRNDWRCAHTVRKRPPYGSYERHDNGYQFHYTVPTQALWNTPVLVSFFFKSPLLSNHSSGTTHVFCLGLSPAPTSSIIRREA